MRVESGELKESLKSLQFVIILCERQRNEERYHIHAHPADSKSWHEGFVLKLSDEENGVKVTVNMTASRNTLSDVQRSRQIRPKKLVTAIVTGLKDQLSTIEWTVEDHEKICDNITGKKLCPEDVQIGRRKELELVIKLALLKEVPIEHDDPDGGRDP